MFRIVGILIVIAGVGALFGPRRLRLVFWLMMAGGVIYTALRLAGILTGPEPAGMG